MRAFLSAGFVAGQIACLIILALTGPLAARDPLCLALEAAALLLGIWAVASMRIGNFGIRPDVRPGARFVRRGPYRFIRHPMYTALLLATLAVVIDRPTLLRWIVWCMLLLVLCAKLRFEERLLAERFPEYAAYRSATKRLIPYLY